MADFLLHEVVGFDYEKAVRELTHRMTYENLCEQLGYESKNSIYAVMRGRVPDHIHGEAIYALYRDTFGKKPPLKVHQKAQLSISSSA